MREALFVKKAGGGKPEARRGAVSFEADLFCGWWHHKTN